MFLTRRNFILSSAFGIPAAVNADQSFAEAKPELPAPVRISVQDFGVKPDGSNVTAGIKAAVARIPRTGGILYFPPGRYYFGASQEPTLHFSGLDNLTVEAAGATFLFKDAAFPIRAQHCRNFQMHGFTIDWERPPFSQGEIVGLGTDGQSLDLQIDSGYPVDGSEVIATLATYDRATGLMSRGGVDAYLPSSRVTRVAEQRLHLEGLTRRFPLRLGATVVVRHKLPTYAHAITLTDCDNVSIENVRIYASPSMAVVCNRCNNLTIRNLVVTPTPDSGRLMSTNADAVHIVNARGKIDILGSTLKGMGDDCINVCGQYLKIVDMPDRRKAIIKTKSGVPFSQDERPLAGDELVFVDALSLAPRGRAIVTEAEPGKQESLYFLENIPASVQPGDFVCNVTASANLLVSKCNFPGNRARGILAHANTTIEHCYFSSQFQQAIVLSPDTYWMEGCASENVRIIDNEIHDSIRGERIANSAITIDALIFNNNKLKSSSDIVNRNVLIKGNTITNSAAAAISVNAAENVSIIDNTFRNNKSDPILIHTAKAVSISKNTCSPNSKIVVDPDSKSEVQTDQNNGLKL